MLSDEGIWVEVGGGHVESENRAIDYKKWRTLKKNAIYEDLGGKKVGKETSKKSERKKKQAKTYTSGKKKSRQCGDDKGGRKYGVRAMQGEKKETRQGKKGRTNKKGGSRQNARLWGKFLGCGTLKKEDQEVATRSLGGRCFDLRQRGKTEKWGARGMAVLD